MQDDVPHDEMNKIHYTFAKLANFRSLEQDEILYAIEYLEDMLDDSNTTDPTPS